MSEPEPQPRIFDTDWLDVESARYPETPQGRQAFERLIDRYQRPLLAHLTGKFRFSPDEANDLLQSFIHEQVIVNGLLRRASPGRGQLRSLLVNALERFALTFLRRRRSLKRHPPGPLLPLHEVAEHELPSHKDVTDSDGELVWAQAVIAGALLDMHAELVRRGRPEIWSVFEQRILLPMLDDQRKPKYSDLVQRFGFKSPNEAFNALVTAKRMFQRHLSNVVAQYVGNDREIATELTYLRAILQSALPAPAQGRQTDPNIEPKRKAPKRKS